MIYVAICSYRDPELQPTVADLFGKARHPQSINVGVVRQLKPEDVALRFSHERVRFISMDAADARGVGYVRNAVMNLYDTEDYILQIDSHMRFAQDWDVRMIAQLERCPTRQPILTTYPGGYERPDRITCTQPCFLAANAFEPNGIPSQRGIPMEPPAMPKRTALVAGGFIFGPAQWAGDVRCDPALYFHGEETSMAVRLWSHGWDAYGPAEPLLWHLYEHGTRPLHWQDHPTWGALNDASVARVRALVEGRIGVQDMYGLGRARTVAEYQQFSGIDFIRRTIADHALAGDFG